MEKGEGLRVRKNGDGLRLEIRGRKKEGLRVGKRVWIEEGTRG
jgi:hypothetical protein